MLDFKIDKEFRDLIPALSAEEKAGLEANISAEGCRDALVVWKLQPMSLRRHHKVMKLVVDETLENGITAARIVTRAS
jgi:hypothetical protein